MPTAYILKIKTNVWPFESIWRKIRGVFLALDPPLQVDHAPPPLQDMRSGNFDTKHE